MALAMSAYAHGIVSLGGSSIRYNVTTSRHHIHGRGTGGAPPRQIVSNSMEPRTMISDPLQGLIIDLFHGRMRYGPDRILCRAAP